MIPPIPPTVLRILAEAFYDKQQRIYLAWLSRKSGHQHYALYDQVKERFLMDYARMLARRYWRMALTYPKPGRPPE